MIKVFLEENRLSYDDLVSFADKGEDVSSNERLGELCWKRLFPHIQEMSDQLGIYDTNVIVESIYSWIGSHRTESGGRL